MSTENIRYNVSNIFFPESISKEWIYTTIRKNIDIFNMTRQGPNNMIIGGVGLISLNDEEIQSIINRINLSKDYIIIGEDSVKLSNTNIEIDALIIDTI